MSSKKLFTPLTLGYKQSSNNALTLSHRVVMSPMTRSRALVGDCELDSTLAPLYYSQRASEGGLILTEASQISPQGQGYPYTPGIYTNNQVEAWKKVVGEVKKKGAFIFLQEWHVGRLRVGTPELEAVSSSSTPLEKTKLTDLSNPQAGINNIVPKAPRSLTIEEIKQIVKDYGKGALNAKRAGFDGIEIHGAFGYLIDQFLQDGVNKRTDQYGGSIPNRLRFLQEIIEEVSKHFATDRIGVKLSPYGNVNEMSDSTGKELWEQAAKTLDSYELGYLHVMEPKGADNAFVAAELKAHFKGPLMINTNFNGASAESILQKGDADFVSFGRPFIANPDLVSRLKNDWPLNQPDYQTLYHSPNVSGGYTDYKTYEEESSK